MASRPPDCVLRHHYSIVRHLYGGKDGVSETFGTATRFLGMSAENGTWREARTDMSGRFMRIDPPRSDEGVRRALKSAFAPAPNDIPADMMALLGKLDCA